MEESPAAGGGDEGAVCGGGGGVGEFFADVEVAEITKDNNQSVEEFVVSTPETARKASKAGARHASRRAPFCVQ